MTALVVLETVGPEEYAEVSENAAGQEGSSIYLKAGGKDQNQRTSLRDDAEVRQRCWK